ncbi:MAG TPA: class I SAM-dependent methyltransferase [Ktedonobacterales bacterium]|nr:class I SAM-dependent methyltransferase [Ktedonobacterales bacterium]
MSLEDIYRTGAYSQLAPTWHVDESAAKAREILRLMESHRLTPRTICEVGCGAGEVLRQLQLALRDDTEFTGYDISPQAIELAQPRADEHLHFHLGDFTQEDTGSYDMLLVLDVLEHLEDYFSFLRRLRARGMYKMFFFPLDISVQSVIRPHGLLHTRDLFAHLHYFTKETALRALEDTGYRVLDAVYTSDALDSPTRLLGRRLLRWPRKAAFALNHDVAVHLLGGYRLLVLAQ